MKAVTVLERLRYFSVARGWRDFVNSFRQPSGGIVSEITNKDGGRSLLFMS